MWQCYEYGYAMSQYYGSAMSQSGSAMTHF